ncbi:ribosomal protein L1-like protein [Apodospora peruviana]|uniref:Ribosomal protein L1-like protein n=1 Tax=Apodospora peruviana TaxID=516989 RepID=A0AAE0IKD4_9PEZI|nr:ribosomal protein L1-like protein [Apodospora peruviana]
MASTSQCLASLARFSLSATSAARPSAVSWIPTFFAPVVATRYASGGGGQKKKTAKKKKTYKTFRSYDLTPMEQMSLCDAMRVLRASEAGYSPISSKYEVAVKLRTQKNGTVIRNRIRLPFPFQTGTRIAVICPEGPLTAEARELGAVEAGEESLFENIRAGNITFNKLICHAESEAALKKANLGKILGPKGLMPSAKTRTITNNLKQTMHDLVGAEEYRERGGVVRMPIAQLSFGPNQLAENVKTFMEHLKNDINELDDQQAKRIEEVVLSTTHGPGLSLNGKFLPTDEKITVHDLEGPM